MSRTIGRYRCDVSLPTIPLYGGPLFDATIIMPRIPYIFPAPGESRIADKIRERRKDGNLIELDGILLNSPTIAEGYSTLLKAVRSESSLPEDVKELMILRVAALNSAAYEWLAHEPLARTAGLTLKQLGVVRDVSVVPATHQTTKDLLTPLQEAALIYTDHMTRNVKVPDDAFQKLWENLQDNRQVFEATATVAGYNMVSRILVALDVADKANIEVPEVEACQ